MSTFSQEAQGRLDRYLEEVRSALADCRSVDPEEVEANVIEHINGELEGLAEPVALRDLEAVLERLGSPEEWMSGEGLPWWRRTVRRLRAEPTDRQFALIVLGVVLAAFLLGALLAASSPRLLFLLFLLAGMLWTMVGVLLTISPSIPKTMLPPYADRLDRKWGVVFIVAGLVFTAFFFMLLVTTL